MGERSSPDSDIALWTRTFPILLSMTLKSSAFTQMLKAADFAGVHAQGRR